MKYFRNTHAAKYKQAKYKQAGEKALVMPQDVRIILVDYLELLVHILSKVYTDNRAAIATNYLEKLKVISVTQKVQRDCCTISEATEIWINHFKQNNYHIWNLTLILKRFKVAMTAVHYLANLIDHNNEAMKYVNLYRPATMPDVVPVKTSPFKNYLFSEEIIKNVNQLHTAVASFAGILFSAFGLVHTKLRNRLGTKRASKLVTILIKQKTNLIVIEHEY
ncbi:hypothetical protein ALC53_08973 [Atta colombica]|uniref:Uncharacterized protein n=1 Tax=Atta colombica TaxID=520822 RepID=A0A151I1V2_9HYME|nr:hypothetical protein ALC53_08973 [Atta colombica]